MYILTQSEIPSLIKAKTKGNSWTSVLKHEVGKLIYNSLANSIGTPSTQVTYEVFRQNRRQQNKEQIRFKN